MGEGEGEGQEQEERQRMGEGGREGEGKRDLCNADPETKGQQTEAPVPGVKCSLTDYWFQSPENNIDSCHSSRLHARAN